jgi:hypothetical protein
MKIETTTGPLHRIRVPVELRQLVSFLMPNVTPDSRIPPVVTKHVPCDRLMLDGRIRDC